ncbi:MAG: hypothetical protein J6W75_12625 [Bacteroidaceae bacterium]|nr:hypothetical protein [Bacteroidaceae bacterium]
MTDLSTNLDQPVRQADIPLQWQAFINTMPQAETALAQRMRIMQPTLSAEEDAQTKPHLLVMTENEEVATMMQQLKPRLLSFLRQQLQNKQLDISFKVSKPENKPARTYDKRELLQHYCDVNSALITLVKDFNLELS